MGRRNHIPRPVLWTSTHWSTYVRVRTPGVGRSRQEGRRVLPLSSGTWVRVHTGFRRDGTDGGGWRPSCVLLVRTLLHITRQGLGVFPVGVWWGLGTSLGRGRSLGTGWMLGSVYPDGVRSAGRCRTRFALLPVEGLPSGPSVWVQASDNRPVSLSPPSRGGRRRSRGVVTSKDES